MTKNSDIIIFIVIFLLLFFFIAVIAIGFIAGKPKASFNPNYVIGKIGSICPNGTSDCGTNLTCDSNSYTCKLADGQPCNSGSECAIGSFCSGVCTSGNTGGLNQFCPCLNSNDLICESYPVGPSLCKLKAGSKCDINNPTDCASQNCQGPPGSETCQLNPNSFACSNNDQCESNFCDFVSQTSGFCQNPGVLSGTVGSACSIGRPNRAQCDPISSNLSVVCFGLNGLGIGTCAVQSQGLLSTCSSDAACSNKLECLNYNGSDVCVTNCNCLFTYTFPNQKIDNSCINGMSTISDDPDNTICYNNPNLGCDINTTLGPQCNSAISSCNSTSIMAGYFFDQNLSTNLNLSTNFSNAKDFEIRKLFDGPNFSNIVNLYKMFTLTNGDIDTIFLVDYIQGLVYVEFNPSTLQVVKEWTQIVPYNTSTSNGYRKLIDADSNGLLASNLFLIGFEEKNGTKINNVVYQYNFNTSTLTPYNVTNNNDIPGTQYNGTSPISFSYISVSYANSISVGNDVLLVQNNQPSNQNVFVKKNSETTYFASKIINGSNNGDFILNPFGPVRFYYDSFENFNGSTPPKCEVSNNTTNNTTPQIICSGSDNIAFVQKFTSNGNNGTSLVSPQTLQFSGSIGSVGLPLNNFNSVDDPLHPNPIYYNVIDYDIYSPVCSSNTIDPVDQECGMNFANIITLSNIVGIDNNTTYVISLTSQGTTTFFPYQISKNYKTTVSKNAFYILSPNSCTNNNNNNNNTNFNIINNNLTKMNLNKSVFF